MVNLLYSQPKLTQWEIDLCILKPKTILKISFGWLLSFKGCEKLPAHEILDFMR